MTSNIILVFMVNTATSWCKTSTQLLVCCGWFECTLKTNKEQNSSTVNDKVHDVISWYIIKTAKRVRTTFSIHFNDLKTCADNNNNNVTSICENA